MRNAPGVVAASVVILAVWGITAACGPDGSDALEAPVHRVVEIRDLGFSPVALEAATGDTLTWVNHDYVPHTVTGPEGRWDSGELKRGESYTFVFAGPESMEYTCRYHPTMVGRIGVR